MKLNINNETVYLEQTDKYKTIAIGVMFFYPFKKEKLAEKTLLSALMVKSNSDYPTEQLFSIHCQELYDMGISMRSTRMGRMGLISLSITVVNPKYLKEKIDLLNEAVEMLNTILLKPNFDEKLLEQDKRLLIHELENIYNNKSQYANQQFVKTMFKDELISIKSTGEISDIKSATLDSIKEVHQEMLSYSRVFYAIGDITKEKTIEIFNKIKLPECTNTIDSKEFLDLETKEIKEVTKVIEEQNINQSILCMGYRSPIRLDHKLYSACLMFVGMLGQFFHSTLFQVIREERSLAYYIGSDYNPRKGNMAIVVGIEQDKYDEVVSLVKEIISDYQNGKFDEEILELTKKAFINQLKKQEDYPGNMINNIYTELAGNIVLTLDEKIKLFNNVKVEEITTVANMFELDTIYFLRGKYDEKN